MVDHDEGIHLRTQQIQVDLSVEPMLLALKGKGQRHKRNRHNA